MVQLIVFGSLAYLVGSFPSAYLAGKLIKGIDIREHGSGNSGATNVMRTVNVPVGILVFLLDAGKGFLALWAFPYLAGYLPLGLAVSADSMYFSIVVASCVIAGHIWSVFLRFKGGKGVATTFGVMLYLAPWIMASCFAIWVVVLLLFKYVSVASITASFFLPVIAALTGREISFILFSGVLCVGSVLAHRDNIRRLIKGTENSIVSHSKS